MSRKT